MLIPIAHYDAGLHPGNNAYIINIYAQNGQRIAIPVNSFEEYTALLAMLSKSGVMFNNTNNAIELPRRAVGT